MKEIRYDELKTGDVILWHGAREAVVEVQMDGYSEFYRGEKVIRFKLRPFDKEAEETLGKFYSNGTYGGVGFLTVELLSRAAKCYLRLSSNVDDENKGGDAT